MEADEIRRILDKLDLTQREAAEALGVGHRTVQAWCIGERPVSEPAAKLLRLWSRRPETFRSGVHLPAGEEIPMEEVAR